MCQHKESSWKLLWKEFVSRFCRCKNEAWQVVQYLEIPVVEPSMGWAQTSQTVIYIQRNWLGWVIEAFCSWSYETRQAQFSWHCSFGCWIFQVKISSSEAIGYGVRQWWSFVPVFHHLSFFFVWLFPHLRPRRPPLVPPQLLRYCAPPPPGTPVDLSDHTGKWRIHLTNQSRHPPLLTSPKPRTHPDHRPHWSSLRRQEGEGRVWREVLMRVWKWKKWNNVARESGNNIRKRSNKMD